MDILFEQWEYKKQKKYRVGSIEAFFFSFNMGKMIACLYLDGNDSLKRENNEAAERRIGEAATLCRFSPNARDSCNEKALGGRLCHLNLGSLHLPALLPCLCFAPAGFALQELLRLLCLNPMFSAFTAA